MDYIQPVQKNSEKKDWTKVNDKDKDWQIWSLIGLGSVLYMGIFILIVVVFFYGVLALLH